MLWNKIGGFSLEYLATVQNINNDIEEEVTIVVEDLEIHGFASVCPYPISIGSQYPVMIGLTIFDDFNPRETEIKKKEIRRISNGFSTLIRGLLKPEGIIDAGIMIHDNLLIEYSFLIGKYVEFEVDRVSIEFI